MSEVKHIPDGYTAITPYLIVNGATGFLDFLANAFGAVERMRVPMPGGAIGHAEVEIGGDVLMLADANEDYPATNTLIHLYVKDADSIYAQAIEAGATPLHEPADLPHGDRLGRVVDPSGNLWSIATHFEDVDLDELVKRADEMTED